MYVFFTGYLPPTSKGEVEDGRHINTNIRKRQDHNTNKSLFIYGAKSNSKNDPITPGDVEVFFTYITHLCDN